MEKQLSSDLSGQAHVFIDNHQFRDAAFARKGKSDHLVFIMVSPSSCPISRMLK